ncbi:alpha/beta hydrolase [Novosphingobium sp. ES2-1]|uniref:alpha/beta hydrolase n=1 Tax=Novosphingobium sp. ES2-1 TaxID=2780074 RepID=UPI0018812376|nr:alpha/beta hydrolase [Novosphingobium sp. ES2-1]QOV95632.1 alpha/beta hydrolase [Novosphingobium sp. ES2-1]
MKLRLLLAPLAMLAAPLVAQDAAPVSRMIDGTLASGAKWQALVPANFNGSLLLWSHGYSPRIDPAEPAPAQYRDLLLAKGYALVASDYGAGGWSLEQAVPAQRATVEAFVAREGRPARVLAWGSSMGGLISTALAEQDRPVIDGALAMCPSIGGAVGMMNMGLDGAFATAALIAPNSGLSLVNVADDMANGRKAMAAIDAARQTREGRARIALAGVLGGIPGWTRPERPEPADDDGEAQVDEIAATLVMGTFMPRNDQESRAGGVFSWNTGVNYARQLDRSGRRPFVEAMYRKAGLSLSRDLATLARAPRVSAKPSAVRYMLDNYTPSARPRVPLVSLQAVGDGLTSPSLQRAYADAAPPAMMQPLWHRGAGHCRLPPEQVLAAIAHLEQRVASGKWPARPTQFVDHTPPPMLRPCLRQEGPSGPRCR